MADNSSILEALKGVDPADAVPFGAAATPEGSPTMLSSMLAGVMNIPKHLIDAAKEAPQPGLRREDFTDLPGSAQPGDKLAGAAADTSMALAGAGAPAAEAGTAGIFGGKLAKTADLDKLMFANKMHEASMPLSQIWHATGWFKSPTDQKWKFEIPDEGAKINTHGQLNWANTDDWMGGPAHAILEHPELYKAYPQLGQVQTYVTASPNRSGVYSPGNSQRIFNPKQASLELAGFSPEHATPVGVHEMQHAIQDIEHFATGGTASNMAYMQEKTPSKLPLGMHNEDPYEIYRRLAGEVEARNSDLRFRDPSLRSQAPWETQEYPYNQQIIYDPQKLMIRALKHLK